MLWQKKEANRVKKIKFSIHICPPVTQQLSVQTDAPTHIFVQADFHCGLSHVANSWGGKGSFPPQHTALESSSDVNSLSVSRPLVGLDRLGKHHQQPSRSSGKPRLFTWWLPEWAAESNRRWYFIQGITSNWDTGTCTYAHREEGGEGNLNTSKVVFWGKVWFYWTSPEKYTNNGYKKPPEEEHKENRNLCLTLHQINI